MDYLIHGSRCCSNYLSALASVAVTQACTKMPVPHTGIAKAPEAARQFMRTRITFFAAVAAHCAISRPRLNRTVRRHQPQRKARRDKERRRARHGEATRTARTRLYRARRRHTRPHPPHSFSRPRRRRTPNLMSIATFVSTAQRES
ncbi:hypothetical protein TgHK011_008394 [Trichoderma gracile]|nr:hypothetical protein TgHK011_008394 [Trichoderma gracile]